MAITFFGSARSATDNTSNGVSSPNDIAPPASMTAGDLVVVYFFDKTNASTIAVSVSGGQTWTAETASSPTGSRTGRFFWCRFDGTWSANPSWSYTGAGTSAGVMLVFRPTSGSNTWAVDVAVSNTNWAVSPQTVTGITTSANSVAVIGVGSTDDNEWTLTGTNWTSTAIEMDELTGTDCSAAMTYQLMPSGGASNDVTATQTAVAPDNAVGSIMSFVEQSASPQTVTLSLLDQTGVLFAPQVNQGVALPLLDQSGTLFAPKVNQQIALSLLDQSSILFAPTVSTAGGAQSVTLALLDQSGVLFSPKVNQAASLPLLSQSPTLFSPQVNESVALPLLSSSPSLFAPKVNEAVAFPLLSQSPSLFTPSVKQAVSLPLLNQQATLFAPTITIPGPQTITLPLLDGTASLFAPTIAQPIAVSLPLLSNVGTLFAPVIVSGAFGGPVDPALAVLVTTEGRAILAPNEGTAVDIS